MGSPMGQASGIRGASLPTAKVASSSREQDLGGVTARAMTLAGVLLVLVVRQNFFVEIAWGINWSGSWSFSSGVRATATAQRR